MSKQYICDKCKDVIKDKNGHQLKVPAELKYHDGKVMCGQYLTIDLCNSCLDNLHLFLGINIK